MSSNTVLEIVQGKHPYFAALPSMWPTEQGRAEWVWKKQVGGVLGWVRADWRCAGMKKDLRALLL